jgi:large subunit ribosomal protein L3
MKMAGHMGDARVTVKNLRVQGTDAAKNILLIEGAVPGGKNGLVIIKKVISS